MGTAALVALIMSLCNPRYTATQYALLSSLAAFGRVYVSPVSGFMVQGLGWTTFYLMTAFFAIPGLILLVWLRKAINYEDQSQQHKLRQEPMEPDISTDGKAIPIAN